MPIYSIPPLRPKVIIFTLYRTIRSNSMKKLAFRAYILRFCKQYDGGDFREYAVGNKTG